MVDGEKAMSTERADGQWWLRSMEKKKKKRIRGKNRENGGR